MVYNLIVVVVMVMEKTSAHHLVCADIAKWKKLSMLVAASLA